ncbi:hypothetical protein Aple_074780 [Acrocarpospora pleiomorpha]|uniref:DUF6879 domain-containing protein n=1 Tax=Acrocarpospora pleiomorpha TaxID=90975 RepID=A0A5M3XWX7_9ACTN|nr:DUF6879 family protein [Acrocarpospora pleiomorpha]GES24579.1 hypothetical protein Aple_074780 [Acrocarpospora pleiomorpha]
MLERLHEIPGTTLDRPTYHAMRRREREQLSGPIWKLERAQFFREPADDPSWQSFLSGDWEGVLTAFENDRSAARTEIAGYTRQGSELRRLRVVEKPVSPYLQWEMAWFRILAEEGTPIRVLHAERIREHEHLHPLPEVVLDEHALYHVAYDRDGKAIGARRIADPEVMREASNEIARLWSQGEPFLEYFQREIAALPPPTTVP